MVRVRQQKHLFGVNCVMDVTRPPHPPKGLTTSCVVTELVIGFNHEFKNRLSKAAWSAACDQFKQRLLFSLKFPRKSSD